MACMADGVGLGRQWWEACMRAVRRGGRGMGEAKKGRTLPELGLVRRRLDVCRRWGWEMPLFWDGVGGAAVDGPRRGMGGCEGGLAVGDRDMSTDGLRVVLGLAMITGGIAVWCGGCRMVVVAWDLGMSVVDVLCCAARRYRLRLHGGATRACGQARHGVSGQCGKW